MALFGDATRLVAAAEARRRWRALLALGLLVAMVGTVSLSALAGARRSGTALDRFVAATVARDARIGAEDAGTAEALGADVADEPWVADAAVVHQLALATGPGELTTVATSPDTAFQSSIDRPIVVDGRLPLPGSTTEVAIDERARDQYGLAPGDHLDVQVFDPANFACAVTQECVLEPPVGPPVALVVTGVTRDVDAFQSDGFTPELSAPSSFYEAFAPLTGSIGSEVLVRLEDGGDDLGRLEDLVEDAEVPGVVLGAEQDVLASPSDAIDTQATSLLVFALVTAGAGAIALAQAIRRQLGATTARSAVLGELGMDRAARSVAVALPVVGAGLAGAVVAVVGAGFLSDRFPFAAVRAIEPDPGRRFDPLVLLVGAAAVGVTAGGWAVRVAWRDTRRAAAGRPARGSSVTAWVARLGAPPAVVAGTRLAFDTGRGPAALAGRSALLGAVVGLAGLVATGVVVASQDDLVATPARWGSNWSATGTPLDPTALTDRLPAIGDEDGVAAVAVYRVGLLDLEGADVTGHALQATEGRIQHTLLSGDRPVADDEVALGETTRRRLGVEEGDTVVAVDADGAEHPLEVVGTVVLPTVQDREPGLGALLTYDGWRQVTRSEGVVELVLRFDTGADADDLSRRLLEDHAVGTRSPSPPVRLANLDDGSVVLAALVAFFAALAATGLVHAVLTSARRRRPTFAVWRAIGFTPGQVRRSVLWQGEVVAAVGLLVGIPVGIVAGRLAWQWVIGDLGVVDTPSTPAMLLVVTAPVALLLAALLGLPAARAAARGPAARALRDE